MSLLTRPYHVFFFIVALSLAACVGLWLPAGKTPAFWPASGIACSYFAFSDRKLWPWYCIGFIPAFFVPFSLYTEHTPQIIAVLISAGLLQALVAGFLVQSQYLESFEPRRFRVLINFLLMTSVIAPFFSGFFGTSAFYLGFGNQTWLGYFVLWVVSNGTGILTVIIPFYFLLKGRRYFSQLNYRVTVIELISYVVIFFLICHWIATINEMQTLLSRVAHLLLFPTVLFAAIRYGMFVSSMSCLFFAVYTSACMHLGVSPFMIESESVIHNVLTFDLFLFVLTLTGLIMASLRYESKVVQNNLSDQKALIEALNRKKSDFISAINEQLRAPVTQVVGSVSRLTETRLDDYQVDLVGTINDSSHQILLLIDDVLSFSKAENAHLNKETVEFSLERVLHSVSQSFALEAESRNIGIYLQMENAGSRYRSDPALIKQILTNLITIMLAQSKMSHILIKSCQTSYSLIITLELTGKFSNEQPEAHEIIKANRSSESETLGLFISQKLAEAINGKLTFTDQTEGGIGFYELQLPMIPVLVPGTTYNLDLNLVVISGCQLEASLIARGLKGRVKSTTFRSLEEVLDMKESGDPGFEDALCIADWKDTNVHKLLSYLVILKSTYKEVLVTVPWSMDISGLGAFNILVRPYSQTELVSLITDTYYAENREDAVKT